MPGLSGPGIAALPQRETTANRVRIYFYSSSEEEMLREAADQTGVDGFIRKGDRSELGAQVARALRLAAALRGPFANDLIRGYGAPPAGLPPA